MRHAAPAGTPCPRTPELAAGRRRPAPGVTVTRKQPQPEPPSGDGHAKAGQRPHREPGAAVTGHHADRPGDQRSGRTRPAGLNCQRPPRLHPPRPTAAAGRFHVLQGQPVPDDAPRTQPPPGFAELMAKRRSDSPDSDSPDSDSPDSDSPDSDSPDSDSPDSDSPDSDSPDSDSPDSDSPDSDSPDSDSPDSDSPDSDSPDSDSDQPVPAERPGTEQAARPTPPRPRRPNPPASRPARLGADPAPHGQPRLAHPSLSRRPEPRHRSRPRRSGRQVRYRAAAPGHKMTCLGQT